jgi:hypothetical protein
LTGDTRGKRHACLRVCVSCVCGYVEDQQDDTTRTNRRTSINRNLSTPDGRRIRHYSRKFDLAYIYPEIDIQTLYFVHRNEQRLVDNFNHIQKPLLRIPIDGGMERVAGKSRRKTLPLIDFDESNEYALCWSINQPQHLHKPWRKIPYTSTHMQMHAHCIHVSLTRPLAFVHWRAENPLVSSSPLRDLSVPSAYLLTITLCHAVPLPSPDLAYMESSMLTKPLLFPLQPPRPSPPMSRLRPPRRPPSREPTRPLSARSELRSLSTDPRPSLSPVLPSTRESRSTTCPGWTSSGPSSTP